MNALLDSAPTTLFDGTQAGAASAAPLNGGVSRPCKYVLVQNSPSSAGNLLVGNATSQSVILTPGASEEIWINDVAKVYVKLASAAAALANVHAV